MGRSGELQVVKECSEYTGKAGDHCTITSSNLDEVPSGTRITYAAAAGSGSLKSDIVLDAGAGNTASGHVELDLGAGRGTATISGGTGTLAGFQARADIAADAAGLWHWSGTYAFTESQTAAPVRA